MPQTVFISDLHLDPRRPAISALFVDFLQNLPTACAGLYILGDLFEAWIGDDDDTPHYREIIAALRGTTQRGIPIHVMHGNRDFLLGAGFATETGCTLIEDPTCIELGGESVLLLHGDTLCTDDIDYQQFRSMVRNSAWQRDFLAKPLPERRQLAAQVRETSKQRTGEKAPEIMDVNPAAVLATLRAANVRRMIHGHTHRPAVHSLDLDGAPAQRIVLGDWYEQGSVLYCDGSECRLEKLPLGSV